MQSKIPTAGKRKFPSDIILSALLGILFVVVYSKVNFTASEKLSNVSISKKEPKYLFGYDISNYYIESSVIQQGDVVGNILYQEGVTHNAITKLAEKAREVFSLRNFRTGRNYHLIKENECGNALALIYEPNPLSYVVYDLTGETGVKVVEKESIKCTDIVGGKITSTLWQALEDQNVNPGIIDLMEDALASSVDFYHTKEGDEFKLIFERKFVGNKEVELGKLIGAYYKNDNGENYAVYYENGNYKGYYDENGRPAKNTFLKAPVKFSRISSSYSMRRFHPIKRRTIPHFGTDYAAPYGTPILAVADGVVEEASRTRNNGNFVKIKHDKIYQTQYLHMQGFSKGTRRGKRVKQGDVIGYVGSTGMATGPHVCFRFWKNGKQVNHLKEKFNPTIPLPKSEMDSFNNIKGSIKDVLDSTPIALPKIKA